VNEFLARLDSVLYFDNVGCACCGGGGGGGGGGGNGLLATLLL